MAITVKYLEDLGVEKEVAEKIFAERSKEIEADKAKREKLETELKESKESLETVNKEFEALKSSNAGAEEYKSKYEALVAGYFFDYILTTQDTQKLPKIPKVKA